MVELHEQIPPRLQCGLTNLTLSFQLLASFPDLMWRREVFIELLAGNWRFEVNRFVSFQPPLLWWVWTWELYTFLGMIPNMATIILWYNIMRYINNIYYIIYNKHTPTILSTILIWHSIWHSFWHSISDILSGILSLTFYLAFYLAFYLWHFIWHSIWHHFWHSIWHSDLFISLAFFLTFYVTFLSGILSHILSGILIWHRIWHSFWYFIWHSIWHSV